MKKLISDAIEVLQAAVAGTDEEAVLKVASAMALLAKALQDNSGSNDYDKGGN